MIRSDLFYTEEQTPSSSINMVDDDVLFSSSAATDSSSHHQPPNQDPNAPIDIEYLDADPFAVHDDDGYTTNTHDLELIDDDNNIVITSDNDQQQQQANNNHTLTPSYSSIESDLTSVNSKSALTGGADFKLSLLKTVGGAKKLRELYTQDLEKKKVDKKKHYIYTYLTLLGLLGGFISFSHDIIVRYLVLGKNTLINLFDPEEYFYLRLFIWVTYNLCFIMFALVLTALVAPSAEGSGLAGIKAILNGVRGLKDVLSMKTMIVKYLSLPAVLTAGLYIGKMGPSIHIVTCAAKNLLKFRLFESIRKTKTLKQEMIVCGIAVGCAANDGAVVGGVLFGAELVGTYYSLRNYFKSFYAAFIACMTSRLLHSAVNLNIKPFLTWNVKIVPPSFTLPELFFMLFVAIVMSFVGIAVVFVNEQLLVLRDKYGKLHLGPFKFAKYATNKLVILTENRIIFTIIITLVTSFLSFPQMIGKYMSIGGVPIFEELLMAKPLTTVNGAKGEWIQGNISEVFITISIFITVRYILAILTTVLPVSGGSYLQLLIIGASFGRLVGEGLAFILPDGFSPNHPIVPASYGLVAAAALTSSQTQAFSSVFILLELTGHGVHLPALGASYIGVVISRWLSYSAYDFVIKFRKWPAVLESTTDSDDIRVKYVMQYVDSLPILEEKASLRKIGEFLEKPDLAKTIPIVNNKSDLLLVGCVNTKKLQDYYNTMKPTLEGNPDYDTEIEIEKNTCPITISEDTPLVLAHLLFSKLNLDDVFVVWRGRLIGQVQKSSIIAELTDRNAGFGDA